MQEIAEQSGAALAQQSVKSQTSKLVERIVEINAVLSSDEDVRDSLQSGHVVFRRLRTGDDDCARVSGCLGEHW